MYCLRRVQYSGVGLVLRARFMMSDPIVTIKQGKLRGAVERNVLGTSYIAFHEIPFAAPPIGQLRFKDPQPPAPWTNVKDVGKAIGTRCSQLDELNPNDVIGTEDCLYLNVYTTSLDGCRPVMFWIHGGSFLTGTATFLEKRPDYLLTKDVVVVSSNYRLGPLGFLNLGHKAAPSNQGLKDLIAALEWVKENVSKFGGDPNNVTAFGASAGGAMVHMLTMSPRAKGLFHKGIIQSGVFTWSWNEEQHQRDLCFKLAKFLGKDSTDPKEVVKYLQSLDVKDIVKASNDVTAEYKKISWFPFSPCTDDAAENPVLPLPLKQMVARDACIPVIIGYTSHEFIMFLKDTSDQKLKSFENLLPKYVEVLTKMKEDDEEAEKLLKTARDLYFDGQPISAEKVDVLVQFMSDIYFGIPTKLYVEDRVKRTLTPSYFYIYSYCGTQRTHTDIIVNRVTKGASHVDELAYLFYLSSIRTDDDLEPPAVGTKDRLTMERLTTMWTNFSKTGNPTPSLDENIKVLWEPATKDRIKYLDIGDELRLLPMEPHILSFS